MDRSRGFLPDDDVDLSLSCTSCATVLPGRSFAFWPGGTLLVCATCSGCRLRRTLGTEAWRSRAGSAASYAVAAGPGRP